MTWFQFLAFFMAMLAVGCFASDYFLEGFVDWLKEKE